MARGINKVILIGNLGADPETRAVPYTTLFRTLRIATSESWRDKQTGEQQERTEWHRVAFFGRLAEVAGEYLRKGSQVYIEGSLRTRKRQDKQGNERYSTEIIGSDLQMLGSRGGRGAVSAPGAGAAASGGAGASAGGGAGAGGSPDSGESGGRRGSGGHRGPARGGPAAHEYLLGAREGAGDGVLAARGVAASEGAPAAGDHRCRRLRGEPGRRRHHRARAVRGPGVRSADPAPPAADAR